MARTGGNLVDWNDPSSWAALKHGPVEVTVKVGDCSRCQGDSEEGAGGPCACMLQALGDDQPPCPR